MGSATVPRAAGPALRRPAPARGDRPRARQPAALLLADEPTGASTRTGGECSGSSAALRAGQHRPPGHPHPAIAALANRRVELRDGLVHLREELRHETLVARTRTRSRSPRSRRPSGQRSRAKGSFRERVQESWSSSESPAARSCRPLGVMLGVASVLGCFSIADSQRKQTERSSPGRRIDKLNVLPGTRHQRLRGALQTANLVLGSTTPRAASSCRPPRASRHQRPKAGGVRVRSSSPTRSARSPASAPITSP